MEDFKTIFKYIFYILLIAPLLTVILSNNPKHFKPVKRNKAPTFKLDHFAFKTHTEKSSPAISFNQIIQDTLYNTDKKFNSLKPYVRVASLNKSINSQKDLFDIFSSINLKENPNIISGNDIKRCKVIDRMNQDLDIFGQDIMVILYETDDITIGSNSKKIFELNESRQCCDIASKIESFMNPINTKIQLIVTTDPQQRIKEIFSILFDGFYKKKNLPEEAKSNYKNECYKYVEDNKAKKIFINFIYTNHGNNYLYEENYSDLQFHFY